MMKMDETWFKHTFIHKIDIFDIFYGNQRILTKNGKIENMHGIAQKYLL